MVSNWLKQNQMAEMFDFVDLLSSLCFINKNTNCIYPDMDEQCHHTWHCCIVNSFFYLILIFFWKFFFHSPFLFNNVILFLQILMLGLSLVVTLLSSSSVYPGSWVPLLPSYLPNSSPYPSSSNFSWNPTFVSIRNQILLF